MNLSKRELELQQMRQQGRKAKQRRLSKAIRALSKQLDELDTVDTSDIPETTEEWFKKAKVVDHLKHIVKGKRRGKKSVPHERRAKAS